MTPDRFIVFLFDDFHLSAGDLAQIQKAATKIVAGSLADSDVAAVVSIAGASSGLTRDRAKLQDAIMKLKVQSLLRPVGRTCPDIGYYEADRIQNKHDPMAVDMAVETCWSAVTVRVMLLRFWWTMQPRNLFRLAIGTSV